jgi:hypothetical protein
MGKSGIITGVTDFSGKENVIIQMITCQMITQNVKENVIIQLDDNISAIIQPDDNTKR